MLLKAATVNRSAIFAVQEEGEVKIRAGLQGLE